MSSKRLWNKLFKRNSEADEIALHVSGATVRHRNPFENIVVPRNKGELDEEFIEKWVVPFYMTSLSDIDDQTLNTFVAAAKEINVEVVKKLLSEFDWRPRITAAFFCAVNKYDEVIDIIGSHLLKSEVCYAGYGYCLALASLGGDRAKSYLMTYLDYYLDRIDLWFDQVVAYCALEYLDNGEALKRLEKWNSFVANKPYWSLDRSREHFKKSMLMLDRICSMNIRS